MPGIPATISPFLRTLLRSSDASKASFRILGFRGREQALEPCLQHSSISYNCSEVSGQGHHPFLFSASWIEVPKFSILNMKQFKLPSAEVLGYVQSRYSCGKRTPPESKWWLRPPAPMRNEGPGYASLAHAGM